MLITFSSPQVGRFSPAHPCSSAANLFRALFRSFLALTITCAALASEYRGEVTFNGIAVPGAVINATNGKQKQTTVTDERGFYTFPDLKDAVWRIEIRMTGFAPLDRNVTISPATTADHWTLELLPEDKILSDARAAATPDLTGTATPGPQQAEAMPLEPDNSQDAAEGLLINGSENNTAASKYSEAGAFGNNRKKLGALYNGGIGLITENSIFDAKPYSLNGQNTPKPSYSDLTGVLNFGGPLRIPHFIRTGPNIYLGYQWTRNRNALAETALVPSLNLRNGILTNGSIVSPSQFSPQALALLRLYPLPNSSGGSQYNYQAPAVSATHQDALQSRFDKAIDNRNQLSGSFALQSTRADTPNVLGYSDASSVLGMNSKIGWLRHLRPGLLLNAGYQFSRYSTRLTPFFANKTDISGAAGIAGNDRAPIDWGPPTLQFSSGTASLTDGVPASNHSETNSVSASLLWNRGTHFVTLGGDFRRQQFNYLTQENPRGSFAFTGAATGSDFGDFLEGVPDTSSIAFGNADKYLRQTAYDGFIADDWRISGGFTMNAGFRWEYGAPVTERYGRLANLDITPGFQNAAVVIATDPVGTLTGRHLPAALMRPDWRGIDPRVGIAWRPLAGSSLVVRAGYGVYDNTSVYQSIAIQLAQQPPFSKTFSVQNSAAIPLTLANGFNAASPSVANTYAIDPNFRVGYAQSWQLSVQRDLPRSLVLSVMYSGIKGTRGLQEILPNTYPTGAVNPCPACTAGYVYLTSNGNSSREAGQVQLRRRLHNGFTAQLQYTYSKSLDDVSSLGGAGAMASTLVTTATPPSTDTPTPAPTGTGYVAQNWLDLSAERAPSSFDQRHLLSLQLQYTSGMGVSGGTLLNGWRGALLKEWTFATEITAGSGLPENPIYFAAVPGTGVTGTIRPDYTGAPLYSTAHALALNPAAFAPPPAGDWGNAGRNIITGPSQFTLNATLGRTFRLKDRLNLDLRFDSTNAFNHVTYTSWQTVINNAQYGLPAGANEMRKIQTVLRLRF